MSNPFEAADEPFHALSNEDGQVSRWPARLPIPAGWRARAGPDNHAACLAVVERHWTDMRPDPDR